MKRYSKRVLRIAEEPEIARLIAATILSLEKIERVLFIGDYAPEDVIQKLDKDELTITAAYKLAQKARSETLSIEKKRKKELQKIIRSMLVLTESLSAFASLPIKNNDSSDSDLTIVALSEAAVALMDVLSTLLNEVELSALSPEERHIKTIM